MKKIIINIPPPSNLERGVKVSVEGHAGPSCKSLTAAIENALGTTVNDTETEEFHHEEEQQDQQELWT